MISHYLRDRAKIDVYLQERPLAADKIHKQSEARFRPPGIRDRLTGTSKRLLVLYWH